jgi:hypothetical protein
MFFMSGKATPSSRESSAEPRHFFVLRGRRDILKMSPVLVRLSALCDQTGAMDFLEYLLTTTDNLRKIPHLVIVASRPDVNVYQLQAEDIKAAILLYQYKVFGFKSKVFATSDFDGRHAVIAPPSTRVQISLEICRHLMERGAEAVLLSLEPGNAEQCKGCLEKAMTGTGKRWWAIRTREAGAALTLGKTADATLATMGSHTRRNLRYYRRKAEAELHCSFTGDAISTLTKPQLIELNQASTHPVTNAVLDHRYKAMKTMAGVFCIGVQANDGQWISLLGGRRHHGITEIDWQMNRGGLAKYSVGTVIRSYLIEHEIQIGSEKLFFEGGTPHSMRLSFLPEKAMDIIAVNQSPFIFLLRKSTRWLHLDRNFLLQALIDPALEWQWH